MYAIRSYYVRVRTSPFPPTVQTLLLHSLTVVVPVASVGVTGGTASPESGLPESELPESELPESELPESELPESELPESELPESESYNFV